MGNRHTHTTKDTTMLSPYGLGTLPGTEDLAQAALAMTTLERLERPVFQDGLKPSAHTSLTRHLAQAATLRTEIDDFISAVAFVAMTNERITADAAPLTARAWALADYATAFLLAHIESDTNPVLTGAICA